MLEIALQHRFGGFALDVAFDAPAGVTALFGRSGAGKTTVINAVAGLLRPDAGRIVIDGEVVSDGALFVPAHKRRIGYVFQDARLFPHLTVAQNLNYGRRFSAKPPPLGDVVDLLGLAGLMRRSPGMLSGGEAQRVAIGRALMAGPRLLVMDEPLAALDGARKAEILPYLQRLRDELHLPMLYVSHALPEVARLATTLVVLDRGSVLCAGPAAEVLADPAVAAVMGSRDAGAVITARLVAQDADGLSQLETAAGRLFIPRISAALGTELRLRIPAQDVILARARPTGLSALNILPVRVVALRLGDGPGAVVQLALGDEMILARVTKRSADALALAPGLECFAVLKSLAFAPGDVVG